jgi:hypothetical protein
MKRSEKIGDRVSNILSKTHFPAHSFYLKFFIIKVVQDHHKNSNNEEMYAANAPFLFSSPTSGINHYGHCVKQRERHAQAHTRVYKMALRPTVTPFSRSSIVAFYHQHFILWRDSQNSTACLSHILYIPPLNIESGLHSEHLCTLTWLTYEIISTK